MKLLKIIQITFISILVLSCSSCNLNQTSKIHKVEIGENQGVGANAFLIVLKVFDEELSKVLEKCNATFVFSQPLEELGESSISCFKISDTEIHLRIESTLWATLNKDELFVKKQKMSEQKINLKVESTSGKNWTIEN